MRSPSFVNSALAAHMLFVIPLITRGSVATTTTSVQDGDTFLAIAANAGIPVESLEAANPGVIATDLYAGQVINVPAGNGPATDAPASNPASSLATAAALTTLVTSASPLVSSNTLPSGSSSTTPVSASGSSTMASPTSTSLSSSTLSSTTTTSGSSTMVSPSTSTSISPSSTSITSTSSTPSPSSSPSVTSTSSPPPPAPSVPSTTSSTCMPTPTGKYVDVANVQSETESFCQKYVDTTLEVVQNESGGLNGDSQNANKNDGSTPNEKGYNMTITALTGCSIPNATITYPLPQLPIYNCTGILFDSWRNCNNNKGMGGSVTAGCLVYSFLPDP